MGRKQGPFVSGSLLLVSLVCSGCDEQSGECLEMWYCNAEECGCSVDEDCVVEPCGYPPPSHTDCVGNQCATRNGDPIPADLWEEYEQQWIEACGAGLCYAVDDGTDCSMLYFCVYEPRCHKGGCVGILTKEY